MCVFVASYHTESSYLVVDRQDLGLAVKLKTPVGVGHVPAGLWICRSTMHVSACLTMLTGRKTPAYLLNVRVAKYTTRETFGTSGLSSEGSGSSVWLLAYRGVFCRLTSGGACRVTSVSLLVPATQEAVHSVQLLFNSMLRNQHRMLEQNPHF